MPVPSHWTNQWNYSAVQAPLKEAGIHNDGGWSTAEEMEEDKGKVKGMTGKKSMKTIEKKQ